MVAHARGWPAEAQAQLTAEQRAHLIRLERLRRQMTAIRAGRAPFPSRFGEEYEAKIGSLRDAGHLSRDQELFLRLCGPAEIDRQVTLCQVMGDVYGGIEVPSRRLVAREHKIQRLVASMVPSGGAPKAPLPSDRRRVRRCLTRARRRRSPVRRRVTRTRASPQSRRGGDPPEPPAEAQLRSRDREAA